MTAEPKPHVSECKDGSLLCEWIAGPQGGPQVRFMLSVETTGEVIWAFVGNGEPSIMASGYLPQQVIDRLRKEPQL